MSFNYSVKTFYNCLNNESIKNKFKNEIDLANYLKISMKDDITLEHIKQVEKKFGVIKFIITGDIEYNDENNKMCKELNIIYKNKKFNINHKVNNKVSFVSYKERKFIILDKFKEMKGYYMEDDVLKELKLDIKTIDDIMNYRTEYINIPLNMKQFDSVEDQYKYYVKLADSLKSETEGKINLYKTGSIRRTSLKLLDEYTKHVNPEEITEKEAMWLMKATIGQLVNNRPGIYEHAHKLDIKSMFPYILSNKTSFIPVKQGTFKKLTGEEFEEFKKKKFYPIGIYRVKIHVSTDANTNKLFRFNKAKYYTHIDIRYADYLGLEVELLDKKHNLLFWERSQCLCGHEVFGKYVDYLYGFKEKKVDSAKLLLNIISGLIGQKNIKIITIDEEFNEDYDFKKNNLEVIQKWTKRDDKNITCYKCVDLTNIYKMRLARFMPFLWSKSRSMMGYKLFEYKNDILKMNTDSVILPYKLENLCYKGIEKIGYFSVEYEDKHIEIKSNKKEIFLNKDYQEEFILEEDEDEEYQNV
jgi:hypothetical protein